MQAKDKVIAILCSDLHLSTRPPRARRNEKDWFDAMAKSLNQIAAASDKFKAPILCAGDVFDYWRESPELITFALGNLPVMYAIPGQHDLPMHNIELIKKSAYWTLVQAGKINHVQYNIPIPAMNDLVIHGFPWGKNIKPYENKDTQKFHVALCHRYFWIKDHCYKGSPKKFWAENYNDRISGYHAVAFGDNHNGFLTQINGINVMNCGTLMRRDSNEVDYEPMVGLLCRSGKIIPNYLRMSGEVFEPYSDTETGVRRLLGKSEIKDFLSGLCSLQDKAFDFVTAIEFAMADKRVPGQVRKIIYEALGREKS